MYDPVVGRFLSEDPIEFDAGDPNLSRYVGNHPTLATDPTGLAEDPFPPPQMHDGFDTVRSGSDILGYLSIEQTFQAGLNSHVQFPIRDGVATVIVIGRGLSPAQQQSHILHELMSVITNRFYGYAEHGIGLTRPSVSLSGRPLQNSSGIHNLGLLVELGYLAEHAPSELKPDFLENRFGTINCRTKDDKDQTPLPYEAEIKRLKAWLESVARNENKESKFMSETTLNNNGRFDQEILNVRVWLEARDGRIVGGKIYVIFED